MSTSGLTFDEFASAHLDSLLRFATALTNDRELGADLVQDVLLRAHQGWAHVGSRTDPVPYARRMIVNEFISWRRKWAHVGTERRLFIEVQRDWWLEIRQSPMSKAPKLTQSDLLAVARSMRFATNLAEPIDLVRRRPRVAALALSRVVTPCRQTTVRSRGNRASRTSDARAGQRAS
jgi:DNA-directed RNA polymerase specialized sigma24 family protein